LLARIRHLPFFLDRERQFSLHAPKAGAPEGRGT
jgi:hypothetical protein